ncbi:MAG: GGDEF domain-containing protein [Anaerolineales bacterium]
MNHLRRSAIALLIDLAIFYNIERLNFGQANVINIASVVYILVIMAVLSILTIPLLWRSRFALSLTLWLAAYALCRLVLFRDRPFLGEIYTYLTITEIALLSLTLWLAYDLARHLHDFEEAVKNITFADVNRRVRKLDEAEEDIQTELIRSRRHHHPLTVMVIEPESDSIQVALNRTVQEVQRAMMTRYVITSLARVISNQLRRTDMVLDQRDQGRFVIVSPDTNATSSAALADRIQAAAAVQLGVLVSCGVASFPDEALTFEELVHQAKSNLRSPIETSTSPVYTSSEAKSV